MLLLRHANNEGHRETCWLVDTTNNSYGHSDMGALFYVFGNAREAHDLDPRPMVYIAGGVLEKLGS